VSLPPAAGALRFVGADGVVESWSAGHFAERAAAAAARLATQGLTAGDRLLVVGGNERPWPVLREAARMLGLVFVPVGPRLAPPERDALIDDAEPALVVGAPDLAPGRHSVYDWRAFLASPPASPPPPPAQPPEQLLYTSGSSGRPRGVRRSPAADAARIAQSVAAWGLTAADRHLIAGPLYHSGPAIFWSIFRSLGAVQTIWARFDAGQILKALAAGEADVVFMVPTMWRMILEEAGRADVSRLRLRRAFVAGSPLDDATRAAMLQLLGEGVLWEFYGATETGTVTMLSPEHQASHAGTVGWPAPGVRIEIRDGDGRPLPPGAVGRIYVASPALMAGYHPGPQGEAPVVDRIGDAISVGDRGRLRSDGSLELLGREGGMIITGGINVYPEEVEAALRALPGVREAVVWGSPDAQWGMAIAALVEPQAAEQPTPSALREALRVRLAGYRIPRRLAVGTIPRTPSGKVVRETTVLEAAWAGAAANAPT
jgi:long-chain acyl-CoA synthetase